MQEKIREAKDIKQKIIDEGVKDLISFFYSVRFIGYSKEQTKEAVLDALDFAYKDKEGK